MNSDQKEIKNQKQKKADEALSRGLLNGVAVLGVIFNDLAGVKAPYKVKETDLKAIRQQDSDRQKN